MSFMGNSFNVCCSRSSHDDAGLMDEAGLMESWLSLLLDEGDFFPYH